MYTLLWLKRPITLVSGIKLYQEDKHAVLLVRPINKLKIFDIFAD